MTQKPDRSQAKSVSSIGIQQNTSMSGLPKATVSSGDKARPKSVELAAVNDPQVVAQKPAKKGISLPSWHFLGVLLIIFSGGIGFAATSILLSFNGSSNCNALYTPLASATTRLYCAQLEAEEQTLSQYLKAIRMVDSFPLDHPLRADIDRNIEAWITDIIDLAEVTFQEGKLAEAIEIVEQVPNKSELYGLVEEKVVAWKGLWQEGEDIVEKLQKELKSGDLNQAMRTAVQLSYFENQYWSTVKYDEVRNQIQLARKENGELDVAYVSHRRGGIENWLRAIEQASKISKDSYAYPQAEKLIGDARKDIIRYIQGIIDQQRWDELLSISDRLPSRLNLDNMVVDWKILAQSGVTARRGTVVEIETALVQIQSIQPSSVVYDQSQELTRRWQTEILDVAMLEQAKSMALGGSISELQQAIAKLNLIPAGNSRYSEARQLISKWRARIEIAEDQPTLEYAKDLARSNRVGALESAIAQAQSIKSKRALYSEAQQNIRKWQGQLERREDQPIFDRAVALGNQKEFTEAIAVANQIKASRALYADMQVKVNGWRQELAAIQRQLDAKKKLDSAYQAAAGNSVSGFVAAIKLAQQIPTSASQVRAEGKAVADRWSYSILSEAENQANISLNQAIATAKLVPRSTAAHARAQVQIEAWQKLLRPTIIPTEPLAPILPLDPLPDPQA